MAQNRQDNRSREDFQVMPQGCRTMMNQRSEFIGTWRLVSFSATTANGSSVQPLGEAVVGRITYQDNGRMSVQIMSRERTRFSTDDVRSAPPQEIVQQPVAEVSRTARRGLQVAGAK